MTTEERIAKINAAGAAARKTVEDQLNAKVAHIISLLKKVSDEFGPRMQELMKVARELDRNGITLGPCKDWRPGSADVIPEFVSDGIYHRTGFIVKESPYWKRTHLLPIEIGKVGGGCAGNSIHFDEFGNIVISGRLATNYSDWSAKDVLNLEEFIAEFPEFERRFYEYVDSL